MTAQLHQPKMSVVLYAAWAWAGVVGVVACLFFILSHRHDGVMGLVLWSTWVVVLMLLCEMTRYTVFLLASVKHCTGFLLLDVSARPHADNNGCHWPCGPPQADQLD